MNVLELNKVCKSYSQGSSKIQVLKDLDFQVKRGETVAITGQSGSGKSTLLALMSGIDRPDSGTITVAKTDLATLTESQLTKFRGSKLGIVFQQFHLIPHLTALENVMLALEIAGDPSAESKAKDALASVGLSLRENHYPGQLSGGECQRVAIARAFVTNPEFLIADEPSGNLDPTTGSQVMELLFNQVLSRKMTLIVVTHSMDLANKCQRIFKLSSGNLGAVSKTNETYS